MKFFLFAFCIQLMYNAWKPVADEVVTRLHDRLVVNEKKISVIGPHFENFNQVNYYAAPLAYIHSIFVLINEQNVKTIGLHGMWPSRMYNPNLEYINCGIEEDDHADNLEENMKAFLDYASNVQNGGCLNLRNKIFNEANLRLLTTTYRQNANANKADNIQLAHEFIKHGSCDYYLDADFDTYPQNLGRTSIQSIEDDIVACTTAVNLIPNIVVNTTTNNFRGIIKFLVRYTLREKALLDEITLLGLNLDNLDCGDGPNTNKQIGDFKKLTKTPPNAANGSQCSIEYKRQIEADDVVDDTRKQII